MIFDKKYDNSLWLMMKRDKNVEKEIANLFNGFPQELLISIRESLKKYEECLDKQELLKDTDWYNKNFSGTYQCVNGILYQYKIEMIGTIEIAESFCDGEKNTALRCIVLYPFNKGDVYKMENYEKKNLGMMGADFSIIDNMLYIPISAAIDVEYKKTPFGGIIDYWGYITDFKHAIHRAQLKNIPEEISLDDIQQIEKSKKLVRKKKSK